MSALTELGLAKYVSPLPHSEITRAGVKNLYTQTTELIGQAHDQIFAHQRVIKTDEIATRKILSLFGDTEKMEQSGQFWIPTLPDRLISPPVGPALRYCLRQLEDMTTVPHHPFNWNELRDLIYRTSVLEAYSTSTLLPYEGPDWYWIAQEIAHELSLHAPGPDDLDNWDRARRFLEGPVLMLPA